MKVSETGSVRIGNCQIQKVSLLECARISVSKPQYWKFQNWKVSELEIVRIRKGQNGNVTELKSVRVRNCQNWNVSEWESVRIRKCQNWKRVQFINLNFQIRSRREEIKQCMGLA